MPPGAEFHEHLATNWRENYSRLHFKNRLDVINSILDHVVQEGQNWLDLGCGSGVITAELLKRGARVVALDGSPAMLNEARRTLKKNGGLVSFREGDVQDLTWSDSSVFDGVLCSSVIEYVENPDELIRESSRVLKTNGVLVLSLPPKYSFIRSSQKALRFLFKLIGKEQYAYLDVSNFEISPAAVAGWLKSANIRLDQCFSYDPVLPKKLVSIFRPSLLICEARKVD